MTIELERHFNDPEDKQKDYYAVFNKNTGDLLRITGAPSFKVPMEQLINDLIRSDISGQLDQEDLVAVCMEDRKMADDWTYKHTFTGKTFKDIVDNCPHLAEKIQSGLPRATNKKHKEGISENETKKISVVENILESPKLLLKNKPGVVIQNLANSGLDALNPAAPREDIRNTINNIKATKVQIVFRGDFLNPSVGREILCVRADGKLIGRHYPKENDLDIESTWFDYYRGKHMYQIQLTDPNNEGAGYGMINNSLIIEEV